MAPLVAFVSGSYRPDRCGVADYTRRLALSLEAEGITTCVVTSERSQIDAELPPFPVAVTLTKDWRLSGLVGLARRLSKLRPHVVHVQHSASSFGHSQSFGLFPLLLKVFTPGVPLVTTLHEYGGWGIKTPAVPTSVLDTMGTWFERTGIADRESLFLLSLSRAIIVTNPYHFEYVSAHVPGVAHKLRLVPIGPNILATRNGRAQIRDRVLAELGLPLPTTLICYFGFIHPVKGLETLLRAFRQVAHRDATVHLLVIGGVQSLSLTEQEANGYYNRLIDLREELGLGPSVTFTGYVDGERVSDLLHASDICVLPFNHGASLKSGSLLAALAHGLPVLTTKTEATSEDLRNGENVLMVPPRDHEALARGLERLVTSPGLRASLREAALALANRFSWNKIAGEHVQLYNMLLRSE